MPIALRLHFAQHRQRGSIRDGAPFNQVSVVLDEQRLKGQFPELVIGHDDEIGFAPQLRLRRFEQQFIELPSRGAKAEIAPGELLPKAFGLFGSAHLV